MPLLPGVGGGGGGVFFFFFFNWKVINVFSNYSLGSCGGVVFFLPDEVGARVAF